MLDWFTFGNFDVGGVPVNAKLGQHTAYWGESLLLGGLVHGIAYAQNSVDAWKLQATPGSEAKEYIRPRGGLTIQAQPKQDLSLTGQWFYNWQAVRSPESGQLPVGQRHAQLRRRLVDHRRQPVCCPDSRRAGRPAAVERAGRRRLRATAPTWATSASPRAGARTGSTARSASTAATRPTSCRS